MCIRDRVKASVPVQKVQKRMVYLFKLSIECSHRLVILREIALYGCLHHKSAQKKSVILVPELGVKLRERGEMPVIIEIKLYSCLPPCGRKLIGEIWNQDRCCTNRKFHHV